MLERCNLHNYQHEAVQFVKDHYGAALFLGLGAGKTASSLTVMQDLYDNFEIDRFLVIAPLRVANSVWKQEAEEWEHIDLDFAICTGGLKKRIKALEENATVTVVNRENIPWLVEYYKSKFPFNMIIIDESSSFKNFTSKRSRALKKVMKYVDRCVLLTATPSPNSYMDLYSQFYFLDGGGRLGYTLTAFRNSYFDVDFFGYTYTLKDGAMQTIESKIQDIVMSAKYEDLPDYVSSVMTSPLSGNLLREYTRFENDAMLNVGDTELTAVNAAVLTGKLLQFCSGAVYDEDKDVHHFHNLKLDMLDEIIEFNPDENLLVAYNYKHELERLKKKYPDAETLDKEGVNIKRWNDGEIKMLLVHPASAGHGIQLQHGGHILIWFGFTWSLELYEQLIGRIHRQGQKEHVNVIHLAVGEVEERLMKTLNKKGVSQQNLLEVLKHG